MGNVIGKQAKRKCVSKRTWDAKVRKFAKIKDDCGKEFDKFVLDNTKGWSAKRRDAFTDNLCSVIDNFILLHTDMYMWCRRNNVNIDKFVPDVINN